MSLRFLSTLILIISVCAFPLYITLGIGLFSIVWFKNYYEAIPIAYLSDAIYGLPIERFHMFPYVMTLLAAVLVLASVVIRRHLFDGTMQKI